MPRRSRRIAWPTLALALWLGPAARADVGLRLSVSPARLLLGTDTEAKLRIEVEPGTGQVEAWASVGVVGEPKAIGSGVFEARYSPPRQRFPQLAILAVLAQTGAGPVHGWIVLPLWGQGAAEVRTRPATPVTSTESRSSLSTLAPRASMHERVEAQSAPVEKLVKREPPSANAASMP